MLELTSTASVYGQKIHIVLEETGLPYAVTDAEKSGPPHADPIGRTPSLRDPHGPDGLPITLGESGAIAFYLARKAQKLGPENAREIAVFEYWSHVISATLSPQFAVARYFADSAPERIEWAVEVFTSNAHRVLRIFEERMATRHFMAGERFTILDALFYPHLAVSAPKLAGDLAGFPNLERYRDRIGRREGVRRGMAVLSG
jgi:GST-like protein